MFKVIDAGALRSDLVDEFLAASTRNRAVLTDYASMESFKGAGSVNIRNSMKRLSRFPDQVVILHSTQKISRLKPRSKGLVNRLIDPEQTANFSVYCDALFSNTVPTRQIEADIKAKQIASQGHLDLLLKNADSVRIGIATLAQSYAPSDVSDLRARKPISAAFSKRIVHDILMVTAFFFKKGSGPDQIPPAHDVIYSFPFRYALCAYLLSLKWIGDSGYQGIAAARLRNDFADMTYAAYATFFDGIITEDKKLAQIHTLACWTLENVFVTD